MTRPLSPARLPSPVTRAWVQALSARPCPEAAPRLSWRVPALWEFWAASTTRRTTQAYSVVAQVYWTTGGGHPILSAHNQDSLALVADDTLLTGLRGERRLVKQTYRFRLEGLSEAKGHIRAGTLVRALGALLGTAERATRLAATGRSVARGRRPAWLRAAMDVTVTGLGTGSTTLDIQAPRLSDVHIDLAQRDRWLERPDVGDTALDLAARAVTEAKGSNAIGDYFDSSILGEILKLGRAAEGSTDVRYELIPENGTRSGFVLRGSDCSGLRDRRELIPASRAVVVSGRLDEIEPPPTRRPRAGADSDASVTGPPVEVTLSYPPTTGIRWPWQLTIPC